MAGKSASASKSLTEFIFLISKTKLRKYNCVPYSHTVPMILWFKDVNNPIYKNVLEIKRTIIYQEEYSKWLKKYCLQHRRKMNTFAFPNWYLPVYTC